MIDAAITLARSRLTPAQFALAEQFSKFAAIGGLGFVLDNAVVYSLNPFTGPYVAATVSFCIVICVNFILNRIWTYRHLSHAPAHRQLIVFIAANSIGFVINRGVFFLLVATVPFCHAHLVVPLAAGVGFGMFLNFFLSRRLVFRA